MHGALALSLSLSPSASFLLTSSLPLQIRLQSHFATDGYNKLGGVQRYFADGVREDYASGALDAQVRTLSLSLPPFSRSSLQLPYLTLSPAQVEGALQEMRELSICGLSA